MPSHVRPDPAAVARCRAERWHGLHVSTSSRHSVSNVDLLARGLTPLALNATVGGRRLEAWMQAHGVQGLLKDRQLYPPRL